MKIEFENGSIIQCIKNSKNYRGKGFYLGFENIKDEETNQEYTIATWFNNFDIDKINKGIVVEWGSDERSVKIIKHNGEFEWIRIP